MRVRVVVEIVGHPKEHVEGVIKTVVEKAKKDFKVLEAEIAEAKEIKGLWSTFFEALINFKDVEEMGLFCFDYMPSSVEIEEPEKIQMTNAQLSNVFNDIMAKLHVYDASTKNLGAKNRVLEQKLKRAISSIRDNMDRIGRGEGKKKDYPDEEEKEKKDYDYDSSDEGEEKKSDDEEEEE